MTWPIPQPEDIAARQAAAQVAAFQAAGKGDVDAVSPYAPLGAINRSTSGSIFGVYVAQARLAQELMPDTAKEWLSRHGANWGVPQKQPTQAAGNLLVSGAGTVVPAGATLATPAGVQVVVTAAATIGAGATAVPVQAVAEGSAGNMVAGVVFTFNEPIPGLSPQTGTVDGSGLTGGTDLESIDSWRARIVARIRNPPAGGAVADYEEWVAAVAPTAIVSVKKSWVGAGTVGVLVALPGPSALDPTTQAAIEAYINAPGRRPVTADVYVVAATLLPVDFTLHLNPDTSANRAAALAALAVQFETDAAIGGTLYMSRIDAALENASGEYSHDRHLGIKPGDRRQYHQFGGGIGGARASASRRALPMARQAAHRISVAAAASSTPTCPAWTLSRRVLVAVAPPTSRARRPHSPAAPAKTAS